MNLQTIKALTEVKLQGVKIEWSKEDKGVKEVRISDPSGGCLVIKSNDSYSQTLKLLIPAVEEAERFRLSGKFLDLTPVSEVFESEYDANERHDEFKAKAGYGVETGLTVEKVKVRVSDDGAVISPDDSIPF